MESSEARRVRERYARRTGDSRRYSLLDAATLLMVQERQRALAALFRRAGWRDLHAVRLLEVGCGTGGNLLELLRFGFAPDHLQGIELLPDAVARARAVLPPAVRIMQGDAAEANVAAASQDVVLQSTVFSSLLDDAFQERLAARMWEWIRPGGCVLWYDFVVDNPRNPDVRGVPGDRIRALFPNAEIHARRLTLAPPLARIVARVHPSLYGMVNACPWLRTHILAWIRKA